VVLAYCGLVVGWGVAGFPLLAETGDRTNTSWYLQAHLCALDRQSDCCGSYRATDRLNPARAEGESSRPAALGHVPVVMQ
jgi:hypothetical protein